MNLAAKAVLIDISYFVRIFPAQKEGVVSVLTSNGSEALEE